MKITRQFEAGVETNLDTQVCQKPTRSMRLMPGATVYTPGGLSPTTISLRKRMNPTMMRVELFLPVLLTDPRERTMARFCS